MLNYNNIPILRDAQLMMVEVEWIVKDFPRYYKYTLGSELRKKSMQIYQLVLHVIQHKQNRKRWIKNLVYVVDDLKCQIQIARYINKSGQQNMGILAMRNTTTNG